MSVLRNRRSVSQAEFINTAYRIYETTIEFLARLSARYSRIMAPHIAELAGRVQAHTEQANAIYPSSEQRVALRRQHLLEARASLMALDAALTLAYSVLMRNPQGAFTGGNGKTIPPADASRRLDHLADELGAMIDAENGLLKGAIQALNKKK